MNYHPVFSKGPAYEVMVCQEVGNVQQAWTPSKEVRQWWGRNKCAQTKTGMIDCYTNLGLGPNLRIAMLSDCLYIPLQGQLLYISLEICQLSPKQHVW